MLHINDFILQAQQKGASDLHIVCGLPIKCRLVAKMQTLCRYRTYPAGLRGAGTRACRRAI